MLVTQLKENIKKTVQRCFIGAVATVFFVAPLAVSAQSIVNLDQPPSGFENTAGLADDAVTQNVNLDTTTDVRIFVARLINVALGFIGIILLSLIVYGGWLYMTSEGDAEKINQAKAIFRNAIIGLVIILASWGIATFILNALFGGGGGGSGTKQPQNYDVGVSALGDGIIQSHYPERGQQNVPRNTAIIITFKEEMSLDSICNIDNAASGCDLDQTVIKIFETTQGVELDADKDASPFGAGATVSTNDNKTFVFRPRAYLGSESVEQWYGVRLTEGKLNRANGEAVDLSIENFYQWKFQVSTRLDLTPPRVESVFPNPDNTKDEVGSVQAATKASATIEVKDAPHGYAAAISRVSTGSAVMVEGSAYSCSYSGTVKYTRAASENITDALVVTGSPAGFVAAAAVNNNVAGIGCGLSLDVSGMKTGDEAILTVAPEQPADWLMIGGTRYEIGKDIIVGSDVNATAININNTLKGNNRIKTNVSGSNSIIITVTQSGAAGNSITLASSDSSKISVPATLSGGKDEQQTIAVKGRADEPRNAVVQINFNEAMNPLQLQGKADAVKDYIQVRDKNNPNQFVVGEFMISNVYKTVEFLPTESCGENMCGQPRYCLPPNVDIEVWVKAASLFDCTNNDSCNAINGGFGRYGACTGQLCSDGTVNNPQAAATDGAMDVAFNSLDGNSNGSAEGPRSDFYLNAPESVDGASRLLGDNYKWSFWVSDKIDNTSPVIISAKQNSLDLVKTGEQVAGASTATPLSILFDKLMLSSSLKPGRNYPNDFYVVKEGEKPIHKEYFVFAKFTGRPLGYWVSKQNQSSQSNGTDDRTAAAISHTDFDASAAYGFVTGSGVQDVYQNCYNPAGDSGQGGSDCKDLSGAVKAGISCCKGVAQNNATTMCYDFE